MKWVEYHEDWDSAPINKAVMGSTKIGYFVDHHATEIKMKCIQFRYIGSFESDFRI